MAKHTIEIQADLPSSGIDTANQFGPKGSLDTGDVIAFHGQDDTWTIRLKPGELGSIESYALGDAYIVNNKGNVYWIDPGARSVQFVESRYASFETALTPNGYVLAYDFQDMCCIGGDGLMWRRDNLMSDGIAIEQCTNDQISVSGWQISPDEEVRLRISLKDGDAIG